MFRSKEVDEEEYVLLPMFSKENNQSKLLKNISSEHPEHKDWWMRYYATIEVCFSYVIVVTICYFNSQYLYVR